MNKKLNDIEKYRKDDMKSRKHDNDDAYLDFDRIKTEQINPDTVDIDSRSTTEMLKMINNEDKKVAGAVEKALPEIAAAVDIITDRFKKGGRLIYIGAGTSGRLGVLDATECPPTYGVPRGMVTGIIAGGINAFGTAIEGIEDNAEAGAADIEHMSVSNKDTVVGISSSGHAPYVDGAMKKASEKGAATVLITNSENSEISLTADITITLQTGPEVIMGSTRMKAGSAVKMTLNMLTTASMIKFGKVYKNLMIDMEPSNSKLWARAVRMLMLASDAERSVAENALEIAGGNLRKAIVKIAEGTRFEEAEQKPVMSRVVMREAIQRKPARGRQSKSGV